MNASERNRALDRNQPPVRPALINYCLRLARVEISPHWRRFISTGRATESTWVCIFMNYTLFLNLTVTISSLFIKKLCLNWWHDNLICLRFIAWLDVYIEDRLGNRNIQTTQKFMKEEYFNIVPFMIILCSSKCSAHYEIRTIQVIRINRWTNYLHIEPPWNALGTFEVNYTWSDI